MNLSVPLIPFAPRSDFELQATVVVGPGELRIDYDLKGDLSQILLPEAASSASFREGLWQSTCFELFVSEPASDAYTEWNFAPSGHWWTQDFLSYREEASSAPSLQPPLFLQLREPERYELSVVVPKPAAQLSLGLTAVLAHREGELSYWAIEHGGAQPDFHRADTFKLSL